MATIETKFSVGDTVYFASTTQEKRQHPCPDCLGAREWTATSPAGGEYQFACPRCAARYNNDRDMMLDYVVHAPLVNKLTIGMVGTDHDHWGEGQYVKYMCQETGVGSGQVYRERDLFATEAEAQEKAELLAMERTAETGWIAKLYNKTLEISDYQLESAALKKASDEKSRARSMLWNLGDLWSKMEEADDRDAILEAVREYREYDWARDKELALTSSSEGK